MSCRSASRISRALPTHETSARSDGRLNTGGKRAALLLDGGPVVPRRTDTFVLCQAYAAARARRVPFNVAAPCALIGPSNFFELAVAVAISLVGLNSGAALVTVVGVLVKVAVMLSLVTFANRTQGWFPNTGPAPSTTWPPRGRQTRGEHPV